jgi:hypothetical protein
MFLGTDMGSPTKALLPQDHDAALPLFVLSLIMLSDGKYGNNLHFPEAALE